MIRSPDPHVDAPCSALVAEAGAVRRRAARLLSQLKAARALCEERTAENGHTDPLKRVTGRSSMDNAVGATEGIIDRLDRLTREISGSGERPRVLCHAAPAARAALSTGAGRNRPPAAGSHG
jgi:hypothetical protein